MRTIFASSLLASTSLLVGLPPAWAQDNGTAARPAADAEVSNDIIVTARRREETLQDVPQTINAVSGDTLQKLRINTAADLTQVVSGLAIDPAVTGPGLGSSGIRGVPTFGQSNATPVVQFYLNDAPTGKGPEAAQALFDIGQVEVLKGPQGTLRGRSAPTGAITITTHRPDLNEIGGYGLTSGTNRGNFVGQAAIGLPIIRDVLAIRLAANLNSNEGNGVTSANYGAHPYLNTETLRGTVRFQPSDNFNATIMYQRAHARSRDFAQVMGPGIPGRNGPAIAASDRLGITDQPGWGVTTVDFLVGQAEWRFGGQKLSYVGSYRYSRQVGASTQDSANLVTGAEYFQNTYTPSRETSQELRLSSEEMLFGMFDYTIGAFYDRELSHPVVSTYAAFLTGAFGPPGAAVPQTPNDRYALKTSILVNPVATEKSLFGSITAHLGRNTEISAGGRYVHFERLDQFSLNLLPGFNALNNPTGGFIPCAGLGALSSQLAGAINSPTYPGRCELPIPGSNLQNENRSATYNPFLYNFSISHKFSPDFMVYANLGKAFRSAGPAIGITSLPTVNLTETIGGTSRTLNDSITDLLFHKPETSKTYEVGFKASFLDKRIRVNAAYFHQDFKNFYYLTQSTNYLSVATTLAAATVGQAQFTTDVDAVVNGIDLDASFQITPHWYVNTAVTWSRAKIANSAVPCNDSNFDGVVDNGAVTPASFINAGVLVARCKSNGSIAREPLWNLNLQSEYSVPVADKIEGFARGNWNYYPSNPNSSEGTVIPSYNLLNMYLGARSPDGAWEVSLFANNLLNEQQVLSISPGFVTSAGNPQGTFPLPTGVTNSGYRSITYTPRREFGLQLRYAFGSR